jgi:hypothetical protein
VPVIALTGDFSACAPHVTLARQLAWNFAATNKDFFDLNDGKSPASQLKQHLDLDEMPMPTTVPIWRPPSWTHLFIEAASIYRGYFTYLAAASSLNFSARPPTPELPILPRVIYRPCASREAALAEAKKRLVLQGF